MGKYLGNKHQQANQMLQDVITETLKGGYLFTPEALHSILLKKGLVEVAAEIFNEAGELATRATEAGLAMAKPEQESVMPKNDFALGGVPEDFVMPVTNRGGARGSKYPFAEMEVNQSFFVANSDVKGENAVKTMTGACSKANKLHGKPKVDTEGAAVMRGTKNGETQATEFIKIFKAGPYAKDVEGTKVDGAMVVRTA